MKAGPVLLAKVNVLVAEWVMEWQRGGDCWITKDGITRTLEPTSFGSFQPSTDIAAAMEIVEVLKDKGCFLLYWHDERRQWGAAFVVEEPSTDGFAETAPLAICFAAFKAKGIEMAQGVEPE